MTSKKCSVRSKRSRKRCESNLMTFEWWYCTKINSSNDLRKHCATRSMRLERCVFTSFTKNCAKN